MGTRLALLPAAFVLALTGLAAAELTGPPTALDLRRFEALEALDAHYALDGQEPRYPGPNLRLRQDFHEQGYQDKVAAIFGLVDAGLTPEGRLDEANRLLRYELLGKWPMQGAGQVDGDSGIWMHRSRSLGLRLFALYRHDMDRDLVAEHERRLGFMIREPFTGSSENIRTTNTSAYILAHELLGRTRAPTYAANVDWMLRHLRRLGTEGPTPMTTARPSARSATSTSGPSPTTTR